MCLVLEMMATNLEDLLEAPGELSWEEPLLRLSTDVARGMHHLHSHRFFDEESETFKSCVLHRDIKPANILISPLFAAKISDFGSSRSKPGTDVKLTSVGTPLYCAPEVAAGEGCEYYRSVVVCFLFY